MNWVSKLNVLILYVRRGEMANDEVKFNKAKVNVLENGSIAIIIKEGQPFTPKEINNLIDTLKTAQSDAIDIIELNKKRASVLKNYNGQEKPVKFVD